MFLADQQAGIPSGMLVTDQSDGGAWVLEPVGLGGDGKWGKKNPS